MRRVHEEVVQETSGELFEVKERKIMWRLTIEQTTKKKYTTSEGFYDDKEVVIYESEEVGELLLTVHKLSRLGTIGEVKYTIEKVGEK